MIRRRQWSKRYYNLKSPTNMLPSSESGVAAAPMKKAITPKEKAKVEKQPVQPLKSENAPKPDAATVTATQQAVGEGIKNPDNARNALKIIANSFQKSTPEGSTQVRLNLVIGDQDLEDLRKSENPQNKALACDFQIAIYQKQITDLEARDPWQEKNPNPDYEGNKLKAAYQAKIAALRAERGGLKDKDGHPFPAESQITALAKKFAQGDKEDKQADNDPISLLTDKFNAAAHSKEGKAQLDTVIQSLKQGLPTEEQEAIDTIAGAIEDQQKGVADDTKKNEFKNIEKKVLKIGGNAAVLMLLMMWIASKEWQGAAMK